MHYFEIAMLATNLCATERFCTLQLDIFLSFSSVPANVDLVPKMHVSLHVSSVALPELTTRLLGPSEVNIKYLSLVQNRLHSKCCFMHKPGNYLEIFKADISLSLRYVKTASFYIIQGGAEPTDTFHI
jgi:hypothetical protein